MSRNLYKYALRLCLVSYYIIIRGPLGVGKSTISERLAKLLGAEHIYIDRILDEHNLTLDKEQGYISRRSFKLANEILVPRVKKLLEKGTVVVIDGNFYWKSQVDGLISRLVYPHYVFTLKAPVKLCIERDNKREKKYGCDAALVVHKKATEFDYGVVIDATGSVNETVNMMRAQLPKK